MARTAGSRVNDRGHEHPDLQQEGHNIADVSVLHVDRRQPYTYPHTRNHRQQEEQRQPENANRRCETVRQHHPQQDDERQTEIDKSPKTPAKGIASLGKYTFLIIAALLTMLFAACVTPLEKNVHGTSAA